MKHVVLGLLFLGLIVSVLAATALGARSLSSPLRLFPQAGQQQPSAPIPPVQDSPQEVRAATAKLVLEDGTPVRLKFGRRVSSAEAIAGETVDFQVVEEVRVGELIVIPKDSLAWATVTMAQPKRRMARGGNLNLRIDTVRLASGERAPLRMVKEVKGGSRTGVMTAGVVTTGILFFPAAPFFLFMHGKDVIIPKGTEVSAYVNGDYAVDPAKFPGATATAQPTRSTLPDVPQTQLRATSTPPGADVELDGKPIGTTPVSVLVPAGEHTIRISKAGYTSWERKVSVTGAMLEVNAELEPLPEPH